MPEVFTRSLESPLGIGDALFSIGFSLLGALVTYLMYQLFYGSRHIGAGVHNTFIVGGPAITALFLGIQTSIPLSLGLLGALSFVRFRTPVKDPAEIGFLLLLIASSVGAATGNYLITALLFANVFVALGVQWLARNRVSLFGRGHLMISVDRPSFAELDRGLSEFLDDQLRGLTLENMTTVDDRVGLHYQYRRQRGFDWAAFTNELNRLAGNAKVEIYIS